MVGEVQRAGQLSLLFPQAAVCLLLLIVRLR
jgi:hypothetical protein